MKKLLIIKAGKTYPSIRKAMGDFEDWVISRIEIPGPDVLVHSTYEQSDPPDFNEISAVIITGSHAMVTSKSGWIKRLSAWLQQAARARIPLLGICFGHQLIAQTFGGLVAYHSKGMEIGTTVIKLTGEGQNDPLFKVLPPSFPVHVAHAQTVVKLPPGARLLAGNTFEPHQAFSLGQNIWGLQFHPEFNADILRRYIRYDKKRLEKDGYDIQKILGSVSDTPYGKIVLKRFLEITSNQR
jgi:GMP synthase (glutamine-hydrolysing)